MLQLSAYQNPIHYEIYQLKPDRNLACQLFAPSDNSDVSHINVTDYEKVYEAAMDLDLLDLESTDILESLFVKFNIPAEKPASYKGHSISVSDVIVLSLDGGHIMWSR